MQCSDIFHGINNINNKILPEFSIFCVTNSLKCHGCFSILDIINGIEQFCLKLHGLLGRVKLTGEKMENSLFT